MCSTFMCASYCRKFSSTPLTFYVVTYIYITKQLVGDVECISLLCLGRRKHRIHRHGTILRSVGILMLLYKVLNTYYIILS